MNIPTWNEIKILHPQLKPFKLTSRLGTAQGSTLTNYGTMEQNKLLSKPFKQTFHITDIKHDITGIPFITNYIPTINILIGKIHIKDKYTRMKNASLTFFQGINKQPPIFSKFDPINNQERKQLKPLSGSINTFSIKQIHQNIHKEQNIQHLFMSALEFKPIHKFFRATFSSIKYMKDSNSDKISLHSYKNSPYKISLPLDLLGYCETNATISPTKEIKYRVNKILQLLDIFQSTILDEELSIDSI